MKLLKYVRNFKATLCKQTALPWWHGSKERSFCSKKGKKGSDDVDEDKCVPSDQKDELDLNVDKARECHKTTYKVIIVGAGLSGLSAACRLLACNVDDILILEARERPGGRVDSRKMGSTNIDLGGEFIEGASIMNPLYQLGGIHDLICHSLKAQHSDGVYIFSDGRAVEGSPKLFKDFMQVFNSLPKDSLSKGSDKKFVFDHIESKMMGIIERYSEWEKDDALRMVYSLMNDIRAQTGEDLCNVSLKNHGTRVFLPGDRYRVKDGALSLIAALLSYIPKEKVLTKKGVQTIWWQNDCGEDGCRVKCWDGTEYKACHVIVTVSLGALLCQNSLFSPGLPQRKIDAIQSIPFGKMTKVFMRYKNPFWMDDNLTLRFGWKKEELKDRQDWIKGIGSIEQVPSETDKILRITVSGREAVMLEDNEDFWFELMCWIKESVGIHLPQPDEYTVSTWNKDILFGGGMSASNPRAQEILAEALPCQDCPALLFAGEATVPYFSGSMHAAASSGVREANNLLTFMKKFKDLKQKIDEEYADIVAEHQAAYEEYEKTVEKGQVCKDPKRPSCCQEMEEKKKRATCD